MSGKDTVGAGAGSERVGFGADTGRVVRVVRPRRQAPAHMSRNPQPGIPGPRVVQVSLFWGVCRQSLAFFRNRVSRGGDMRKLVAEKLPRGSDKRERTTMVGLPPSLSTTARVPPPPCPLEPDRSFPTQPCQFKGNGSSPTLH